jgi:putative membrane protein
MDLLLSWLVLTLAVLVAAWAIPGVRVSGLGGAIFVAAIFGILNFFLGWLLFVVIGLGTLGVGFLLAFVTRWVVDAVLLKLTDVFTRKLTVDGFWPAVLAALVMAGVGTLAQWGLGAV